MQNKGSIYFVIKEIIGGIILLMIISTITFVYIKSKDKKIIHVAQQEFSKSILKCYTKKEIDSIKNSISKKYNINKSHLNQIKF